MEIGALHPVAYPQQPAQQNDAPKAATQRDEAQPAAGLRPAAGHDGEQLNQEELQQLEELKARDREVRAHEQAHAAAAGSLARGGPSFTTQRGPDGRWYAVGGEVQIDTSAVPGDLHATLQKALQIQRAALAPASPSAQDRAVAAGAAAMAAEARMELARQGLESQPAEADAARPDQPADRGTAEAHQGQCPVCGAGHGTSAQNEALAQHFANTITPRQASGKLISTAV